MRDVIRNAKENNKTGAIRNSKYAGVLNEKHNIKNMLERDLAIITEKKDEIERTVNGMKERLKDLYHPERYEDCSKQALANEKARL